VGGSAVGHGAALLSQLVDEVALDEARPVQRQHLLEVDRTRLGKFGPSVVFKVAPCRYG